jgi:hypothetical protein
LLKANAPFSFSNSPGLTDDNLQIEDFMQLILDDDKTKQLLTEVLVELLQQKREVFYDIVLDALEEVGLAKAIQAGDETEFVDEAEIASVLTGES